MQSGGEVRETLSVRELILFISSDEIMQNESFSSMIPEDMRDSWAKNIPLRRAGQPEDVAGVALFLASDMSAYVSGQVINCCGAMSC